jgi:hypothetical protein
MKLSTAYRYKFLKDYRIGVPELLSEVSYQGNIIFNESDLRKSIGWIPNSTFNQIGQDIDGESFGDQFGSSVSINDVGDRIAIGSINNDDNGNSSGHTRVYQLSGNTWVQLGQDIDGELANDQFGSSVSINAVGDRVAIGATQNDGNGNSSGHTRVYQLNDNTWVQLGQDIDGELAGDLSGYSVSMNAVGDRVAIGATQNDGNGNSSGHTRVYQLNDNTWVQLGQDIDGEAGGPFFYMPGDFSGYSVSINAVGDRVAIGAALNDGKGLDSGHTRVYQLSGNTWVQLGQDIDGEAAGDLSGYSVSINAVGDRVAIGATNNDGNGSNSGHTRVYQLSGTAWTQLGADIYGELAGDLSGYSVSMNAVGDRVAIGATQNDGNGSNSGSVRSLDLTPKPLDRPYTAFNDENINITRPRWKYINNLNITGGWYDTYNSQFITNLDQVNLSASANSDRFTELNSLKGYKWIEIATKKNTNISLSATQLSSVYFKLTGFSPRLITSPVISWTYNSNIVSGSNIYNNIFRNVAPNFTTLSTQNLENIYINYTPEIQPLSTVRRWNIGNVDTYFTQNATLSDFDGAKTITYFISAYSYKNVLPVTANSSTIYTASTGFFDFANKSTSSLKSRLTSVTPLTSTRNVFTVANRTAGIFTRNPQMWCADLTNQLTALVVQKLAASVYSYGGILITPRHLLYCQHAFPRTERVRFVTANNIVISAAPLSSVDSDMYRNDLPIASLSSIDTEYRDIGIVLLDRDVSLSGIHVMPMAAITPTERTIITNQFIPTLLCTQAPGRSTGSTNPNAVSASDIQMTISSTNFQNMTTAWGTNSANPFYSWDVVGGGYRLWDGDSGNSHLFFCNDKLYVYSITKYSSGSGVVVSALSGIVDYLIEKVDQLARVNTGLRPTYYTLDQIANR